VCVSVCVQYISMNTVKWMDGWNNK